jgi:hypothetical protein
VPSKYEENYVVDEIYPKILVFKGAVTNSDELVDFYEKNGEWDTWFKYGTHVISQGPSGEWDHYPTESEWALEMVDTQSDSYKAAISKIFYEISDIYRDRCEYQNDSWICRNWNLAKYNVTTSDDLVAMEYHTDFQAERADMPGPKFGITCVFYSNDDYEGGEITFTVKKDDGSESDTIDYKPSKGDVLIFPSTAPYYHGVRRVLSGNKYITRLYWVHNHPGTPIWHSLKEKYGDQWEIMEEDRIAANYKKPYFRSTLDAPNHGIDEYYERLENGTLHEWD